MGINTENKGHESIRFDESDFEFLQQMEMGMEMREKGELDAETKAQLEANPLYHDLDQASRKQLATSVLIDREAGMEPDLEEEVKFQKLMQDGRQVHQAQDRQDKMLDSILERLQANKTAQISEEDKAKLEKTPGFHDLSRESQESIEKAIVGQRQAGKEVDFGEEVEQAAFFEKFGSPGDYDRYHAWEMPGAGDFAEAEIASDIGVLETPDLGRMDEPMPEL